MLETSTENTNYLYRQVIDLIGENIDSGTLKPGDRLPSLRRMSTNIGVSVPTVRKAYIELERLRRVESRPQSGFYVRGMAANALVKPSPKFGRSTRPVPVTGQSLMERVNDALYQPDTVPFGIANPCMTRPAAKALHRAMKRIMARAENRSISYAPTRGEPGLRRQIAYRYLDTVGMTVEPENICITNGGQEALLIALQTVASKGDVIAVESPTYHGLLELIDSLGMLAIEVETCPEDGVMLDSLEKTLTAHPVKACLFSTTLSNPLGVSMTDDRRRKLVQIIEQHDVCLIEDDVYGELLFDGHRPKPAQTYSTGGRVLTCGSFSKTAAPGYRIGWLVAGNYIDRVAKIKRSFSCSSGLLQQLTLAEFLANGDYDRYLNMLRPALQCNAERMQSLVSRHFPKATRTSCPVGGSVMWLELPNGVDAEKLFDEAIAAGISIAPGHIFSPCNRYSNFIRLSFGHPWSEEIENGLAWLGKKVGEMSKQSQYKW
jgi:DNA-binding transcriptional MocR family regulator